MNRVNKLIFKVTLLVWLMMMSKEASAADYYFSIDLGNDSRSPAQAQNPDTPWKTISKLNEIFNSLNPGDAIYFRRGETYYGMINISRSGEAGQPIHIGAYGSGEQPVISALTKLDTWKSLGNGVFEATHARMADRRVNTLLFNGINQEMGRYPNSDSDNKGFLTYESSTSSSITSNQLPGSPLWAGAEVVIKKVYWIIDRHKITSHQGNKLNFEAAKGSSYTPRNNFGYFIQNHPSTLDKKGEWFYDADTKKLLVHFAHEPSENVTVEASFLDHLITSNKSVSHIIIDNLELKGANSRAISFVGGRNIKVSNCTVRFSGETGLYFSGTKDLVIENNEVSDSNINGIFLGAADNAHISSNRILRTFLFPGLGGNGDNKGAGIFSNGNHNKIEFNEVISSGYIGIRFGGENTMVNNNLVNFFCLTKNDGGGIYAYTGNKNTNYTNRKIINNIILNGKGVREGTNIQSPLSMPQAEGIYLDDNSSGVEVRGNTIANNSSRGIFLHNARDITVDNNLIYNNHLQMYFKNDHLGEDINNIEIKNNIFLSTKPEQNSLSIWTKGDDISHMGKFESNIYANPFTDNYRINTLVNAGKTHQTTSVFDLDAWKEKYQKDVSSGIQPINIPVYEVKNEIGENKIENGTFDQHANYINCVGGISEWDNSAKLDGGALKISGSGSFNTTFNIGNVVEGKQYIVRFSAVSNQTLAAKTYLQQRGTPWAKASAISVIQTDKERKEYELLFTAAKSLERTSLLIRIENVNNSELFLDNIAFHEAEILPIDPEKKILFEFNASNEDKSIPLYGKFMDMKGNFHSGNIKIAPFSSILLIRTSEEETLIPNLKFISPTSQSKITAKDLELILEMNGDSTYIDRIDFYSDQKLLGSTGAGTFVFTWKDVPEGKHAIYAIGRNEGSRQSLSDTLSVTIEHENLIPVINMDLPKNPQFLKAGEHVFLSSTAVDLDGMISQVQFFEGKNLLATLDSAPFEFNWKNIKAGNYQVFSKATDSKGLAAFSDTVKITVSPQPLNAESSRDDDTKGFSLFLNTGSSKNTEFEGVEYIGDHNLAELYINANAYSNSKVSAEALFQTERNGGNLQFSIPVPNGTYQVKTLHNELWFGHLGPSARAGRRVFDIAIEGKVVKKKFDLFKINKNRPKVLSFENIEVIDGLLNIDLKASANRASISGIAIIGDGNKNPLKGANLRGYREMGRGYREMGDEVGIFHQFEDGPPPSKLAVSVFPNPANDIVNVALNGDIPVSNITIHDMGGKLVHQIDPYLARDANRFTIPLNKMTQGVYLISIWNAQENIGKHRLIVQP